VSRLVVCDYLEGYFSFTVKHWGVSMTSKKAIVASMFQATQNILQGGLAATSILETIFEFQVRKDMIATVRR
jgi:hypothetical protein